MQNPEQSPITDGQVTDSQTQAVEGADIDAVVQQAQNARRMEEAFAIKPDRPVTDAQLKRLQEFQGAMDVHEGRIADSEEAEAYGENYFIKSDKPLDSTQTEVIQQGDNFEELAKLFGETADKEHQETAWKLFDEFVDKNNLSKEEERARRNYLLGVSREAPAAIETPSEPSPSSEGKKNEPATMAPETEDPLLDINSPEQNKEAEELLESSLKSAGTIDEVKAAVKAFGRPIMSSGREYNYDAVSQIIDEVQNNPSRIGAPVDYLTRTHGLRDAVFRVLGPSQKKPLTTFPDSEPKPSDGGESVPGTSNTEESPNLDWGENERPTVEIPSSDTTSESANADSDNERGAPIPFGGIPGSEPEESKYPVGSTGEAIEFKEISESKPETESDEDKEKMSILERAKNIPFALQGKIDAFFNDGTEEQNRTKKLLAAVIGATAAALAVKYGISHLTNEGASAINSGSGGGISPDTLHPAMASGHDGTTGSTEVVGHGAETIEKIRHGETIWSHVKEALLKHDGKEPSNWKIFKETARTLKENGLTWANARLLADNTEIRLIIK